MYRVTVMVAEAEWLSHDTVIEMDMVYNLDGSTNTSFSVTYSSLFLHSPQNLNTPPCCQLDASTGPVLISFLSTCPAWPLTWWAQYFGPAFPPIPPLSTNQHSSINRLDRPSQPPVLCTGNARPWQCADWIATDVVAQMVAKVTWYHGIVIFLLPT